MQAQAIDVHRRAKHVVGYALGKHHAGAVDHRDVPLTVDDRAGVWVVGIEHPLDRGTHVDHRRIVE